MASATSAAASHPYIPADLNLPDYVPNFLSVPTVLGIFISASIAVVFLVWLISGRCKVVKTDRILMCWWAFTGLTHMILEGYFVFSPEFYKDKTGFFLAEVWKEYSKGDSRYAGRDTAIVAVEGITAVLEGPFCILAVYAIASKKSYSYILQFAISLAQVYGTFVYFIAAILDGDNFSSSVLYYYGYYIFMNSFWLVIPTLIAVRCWRKICVSIELQSQSQRKNKRG